MSRVFIDTGHGRDNATVGRYDNGASGSGTTEAAVVRTVAAALLTNLQAIGIDAQMAPDGNIAAIRIPWQRKTLVKGDLFVSLHMNSGAFSGTSVFYPADKPFLHDDACQLSADIAAKMGTKDEGGKPDTATAVKRVGVLHANPDANQLLIEMGRIGYASDVKAVLEKGADAISYGISRLVQPMPPAFSPEEAAAWSAMLAKGVFTSFTKPDDPVTARKLAVFLSRLSP